MAHLSTLNVTVGLFVLGIIYKIITTVHRGICNPLNGIPGPLSARWTNLRLKLAVLSGRRIHYVESLHQEYGAVVRLSPNEVAVNEVQGFKQIHGINSGFTKSPWYTDMTASERPGVFSMTDPKAHAARRRLFARAFSKTHLREHWEAAVKDKIVLAVSRMQDEARSSAVVDVLKCEYRAALTSGVQGGFTPELILIRIRTLMATDVSSHLMFGECFRTLERGEINDYIVRLQMALKGGGIGYELPIVRQIGRYLPFQSAQELFGKNGMLMDYAQVAVNNLKTTQGGQNIFANIAAEAEKGERLDETDVRIEALGLIIAGTDTTAVSLTYLVWAVLSNPIIQEELEEELAFLPDGYTDADLEGLKLLGAVIQETLRLYGAAPGMLPRIVPSSGATIGGFFLPPGITATTQSYSLHRDASLYPDPYHFIPSRWFTTGELDKYRLTEAARAVYSPLGAGSRTCLGVHLAYMELRLATAEFFRKCRGARLAPSATVASMEQENFFLSAPVAHKCEISIR